MTPLADHIVVLIKRRFAGSAAAAVVAADTVKRLSFNLWCFDTPRCLSDTPGSKVRRGQSGEQSRIVLCTERVP